MGLGLYWNYRYWDLTQHILKKIELSSIFESEFLGIFYSVHINISETKLLI